MAGILFTDGKLCLAGYNPHKFHITGLGGKSQPNETPTVTAVREVIEELFELTENIDTIVVYIHGILSFDKLIFFGSYSMFVMDFKALDRILNALNIFNVHSKVYEAIPKTLTDLLMTRTVSMNAEFSHLALIPCVYNLKLNETFVNDVYIFKNCESSM